jgi:hypothetical protein
MEIKVEVKHKYRFVLGRITSFEVCQKYYAYTSENMN